MSIQSFTNTVKEWSPVLTLLTVVATGIAIIVGVQGNLGNRLDAIDARLDSIQAESNRQFNDLLTETNRRFDAAQAEENRRFEELNRRFDAAQAENNRRFDAAQAAESRRHEELLKALQVFEGRISRIEAQADSE